MGLSFASPMLAFRPHALPAQGGLRTARLIPFAARAPPSDYPHEHSPLSSLVDCTLAVIYYSPWPASAEKTGSSPVPFNTLACSSQLALIRHPISAPMSSGVQALLKETNMEEFASKIWLLGVEQLQDLSYLEVSDLVGVGMTVVQARKLQKTALQAAAPEAPYHPAAGHAAACGVEAAAAAGCVPDDFCTTTYAAVARAATLVQAAHDAQIAALTALVAAVQFGLLKDVHRSLVFAQNHMQCLLASPEVAAEALRAASHALASLPQGDLHNAVNLARHRVRDYFIWSCQLRAPLGDRTGFLAEMRAAWGNHDLPRDEQSHLMHSHNATVASLFPDAFLSNNKHESIKKRAGRPRPARVRGKDLPHHSPPPGLPPPHSLDCERTATGSTGTAC